MLPKADKTTINLQKYNPYFDIGYETEQYVFYYNLHTSKEDVLTFTDRWDDNALKVIKTKIINPNLQIDDQIPDYKINIIKRLTPFRKDDLNEIKYNKDFRGIKIYDAKILNHLVEIESSMMDYCWFDNCQFFGKQKVKNDFIGFWSISLNNVRFTRCIFDKIDFGKGEFRNIVFYDCKFNDTFFNRNFDGEYSHLFFQNCDLTQVDFTKVNINTFCFFGYCKFKDIKINIPLVNKKLFGQDIINFIKEQDKSTYSKRKQIKSKKSIGSKSEYIYYSKNEKKKSKPKYNFSPICYSGLSKFYFTLKNELANEGDYSTSKLFDYWYLYCRDECENLNKNIFTRIRNMLSRHILGYGYKFHKPLIAWLILVIICSFIYLFSGVNYSGDIIQRKFTINLIEIIPTITDWLKCLYFSIITSTTIGYGDIHPSGFLTMFICSLEGIFGFLTLTMFTVVFAKRFISK